MNLPAMQTIPIKVTALILKLTSSREIHLSGCFTFLNDWGSHETSPQHKLSISYLIFVCILVAIELKEEGLKDESITFSRYKLSIIIFKNRISELEIRLTRFQNSWS